MTDKDPARGLAEKILGIASEIAIDNAADIIRSAFAEALEDQKRAHFAVERYSRLTLDEWRAAIDAARKKDE